MDYLLRVFIPLLVLTGGLVGCDGVEADDRELEFRGDPVPCAKCQFNAAQVNGSAISALDLTGAANEQGVAVLYVLDPQGHRYTLGVHEEEFAAYDGPRLVAFGDEVVGWIVIVDVAGDERRILISARGKEPSWAEGAGPISLYALDVADDEGVHNVCPGQQPGVPALTILHGETYDHEHKQIDFVGDEWITLACRDEAMYKVKRMGYGPKGDQGAEHQPVKAAQRTAALKMVTADYCGTGHSFTEFHTQILWNNRAGTVESSAVFQAVALEAYWDENGARCLNKPRLVAKEEVLAECDLPACNGLAASPWEWNTYVPLWTPGGGVLGGKGSNKKWFPNQ